MQEARSRAEGCARMARRSQRCDGERVFPGGMPHLRRAADTARAGCRFAKSAWRRLIAVPKPGLRGLRAAVAGVGTAGIAENALLCPACRDKTYAFERARSFAAYEGALVRAILLLKFEQIEPLGAWFAERLAEIVKGEGSCWRRTWWCRYRCTASGSASGDTTRRRCSPSRWPRGSDCRIKLSC